MRKILFLISLIPIICSFIVINRVEPYILGIPIILFWMILWLILTSGFLYVIYKFDPANKESEENE
ncbi:DUF3311 domain-containing protein [Scopulibacillus cellulosilyticus]|uniref:DUF3311 domain-containing protein n=1 Tax=Scopulibacillus cellulosilyticus TaxID=2665665 RepID=A0ABW2Q6A5_9BACL